MTEDKEIKRYKYKGAGVFRWRKDPQTNKIFACLGMSRKRGCKTVLGGKIDNDKKDDNDPARTASREEHEELLQTDITDAETLRSSPHVYCTKGSYFLYFVQTETEEQALTLVANFDVMARLESSSDIEITGIEWVDLDVILPPRLRQWLDSKKTFEQALKIIAEFGFKDDIHMFVRELLASVGIKNLSIIFGVAL